MSDSNSNSNRNGSSGNNKRNGMQKRPDPHAMIKANSPLHYKTLGVSPGSAVFSRDMLIDLPFIADFVLLRQKRQQIIDYNLRRENNRRRNFDYQPGQQVLEYYKAKDKLKQRLSIKTRGPYPITQVHTNGTISIQRNGNLNDRVNIRHLRPYYQ